MKHEQVISKRVNVPATLARWRGALLLVGVALLCVFAWWLRAPLHNLPLERDEGAYATIAWRWRVGDVPYRDLFDHKPPLIYLVYMLANLLPGGTVHGVRVLATLYLLLSGFALVALGRVLYGRMAALAALALFLVYGSGLRFQGTTFNSEAIMTLPATLGCLFAALGIQQRRVGLFGVAGICLGLAIAAKPVGAALALPFVVAPLLADWPRARRMAALLWALVGLAVPLLAFVLALWMQGALPAAYAALIEYNRLYAVESLAQGWDPTYMWHIWQPMLILALPAIIGLVLTFTHQEWRSPTHIVGGLWGLALLATALLSLRAYPHYYQAAVPFFALWAGAGIARVGQEIARRTAEWAAVPIVVALVATLLVVPMRELRPLRFQTPYEQIGTLYGPEGYAFFGHADKVAEYVDEHIAPEEPIFVWAAEPEMYVLAGRKPAARFIYDYPIERVPGGRSELLSALERTLPPLIVTYHDARPLGFDPFMPDHGYELRATIGGFDVYGRN